MTFQLMILVLATISLVSISANEVDNQGDSKLEKRMTFNAIAVIEQCEGRDASNYTFWAHYTVNMKGQPIFENMDILIASMPNGKKAVNRLRMLADTDYYSGAKYTDDILYLVTSGNLQGKFIYARESGLMEVYTKKISSVLGLSYAPKYRASLLIAENLDLNVLLSPKGAYEEFKRIAQTVCEGKGYVF